MSENQEAIYENTDELREFLKKLSGKKFFLDCGHKVTFGHFLGNDITVYNGKNPRIICSMCGH